VNSHGKGAAGENRPANLRLWSFVGTYGVKRDVNEHIALPGRNYLEAKTLESTRPPESGDPARAWAGRSIPGNAAMLRLLGCFLDVQNLMALVDATLGAGAVWQLLFVAGWALGEAHGRQKVVRAAKCGTAR
jgi:hypothetical protein